MSFEVFQNCPPQQFGHRRTAWQGLATGLAAWNKQNEASLVQQQVNALKAEIAKLQGKPDLEESKGKITK